ncbi:MAG: DUF502 domain-containing protein [Hydrotalea sp.]|nr:DUF502 domain-containing protein [Hydrotalea sp.]
MKKFFKLLRKYILAGVLATIPLYLTVVIVRWVLGIIDSNVLPFIPDEYGGNIHGLGILILLLFFLVVGFFTANRGGGLIVDSLDWLLEKIPFLGELYGNIKDIFKKFTTGTGTDAFSAAVLVEYPKDGVWTLAFVTNHQPGDEIEKKLGPGFLTIFMPFVPIPTSGTLFIVHETKTIRLDMKVKDALSYMVSLGVAQKEKKRAKGHYIIDKKMIKKLTAKKASK